MRMTKTFSQASEECGNATAPLTGGISKLRAAENCTDEGKQLGSPSTNSSQ